MFMYFYVIIDSICVSVSIINLFSFCCGTKIMKKIVSKNKRYNSL